MTSYARPRLNQQLQSARTALVIGGLGLGKSTLLKAYASTLPPLATSLYITHEEDISLNAFLASWTRQLMAHLPGRVFEGASSAYATNLNDHTPTEYARLIAADLSLVPVTRPLTLLIDQIPQSSKVQTFLHDLIHYTPLSIRFILSGSQLLPQQLLLNDARIIGPEDLTLQSDEINALGWEATPELQGIPGLMSLAQSGNVFLRRFSEQCVETLLQQKESAQLLSAGLLEHWSAQTPEAILDALQLPTDYLQQYYQAAFPLPGKGEEFVAVPLPLRQALTQALKSQGQELLSQRVQALAHVYGATDPVRAFILQRTVREQSQTERQTLLTYARQHLKHWTDIGDWLNVRESLSAGVLSTYTGYQFTLEGDEALLLARAIYETAADLDDLRLANELIRAAESRLLVRQPYLGHVKGLVLLRLGRIDYARQSYEELLQQYFLEPSLERLNLLSRIILCYLQLGQQGHAWGLLRFEQPSLHLNMARKHPLFLAARAATALAVGVHTASTEPMLSTLPLDVPRQHQLQQGYSALDDMDYLLAISTLAEVWADLGNPQEARAYLDTLSREQKRPWARMETAYLQSVMAFREQAISSSLKYAAEALRESRGLSVYSNRPEMQYQDISFLTRIYLRQFLGHIRLLNLIAADQSLRNLEDLLLSDPSLKERIRQCRAILSACLNPDQAVLRPDELTYSYTEILLVLHLLIDGYDKVCKFPYAFGMLRSWRYWSRKGSTNLDLSLLPEVSLENYAPQSQERLPRQLVLRCLGEHVPIAELNGVPLPVNPRQFMVLTALAQASRSRQDLEKLLFLNDASSYMRVVLSGLNRLCEQQATAPLYVFENNQYALACDIQVKADLLMLWSACAVGDLPTLIQAYRGPLSPKLDAPWVIPFVTPDHLRQELVGSVVQAQRRGKRVDRVIQQLLSLDAKLVPFLKLDHT